MAEYSPSKIIKDGNTYNFRDTTKIPLAGSNAISGDLIPATDNSIDIGSSTKNIKMLFTKGITIDGAQLSTVATSGSYNDLSNKPTIPTVNNATLTIQKNGTTVKTFTANASSNVTANITVPTKTSDLTNDSGFITSDDTKIPLAGSNAISGDLIPATTDSVNLGSPSYQWNNAYIKSLTINGVACGDILTHNASEFVDVSTAQTIGGQKIFSVSPRVTRVFPDIALNISDCDVTEIPTEAKFASLYFRDKNNKNLAYIAGQQRINGTKRLCLRTHRTHNINNYYSVNLDSDGDFYPEQNNSLRLGTPALQWNNTYTRNILIDNDINIASSLINKTSTSGVISICGGLNTQDGASIGLYGKDYNGGIAGNIYMTAYGNSDYTNFRIYPNGTMSVYNNSTATTKNVAMQEDVVNLTTTQTIGGNKEFTDLQTIRCGTQYKGGRDAYILPEFSAGYSGLSITTSGFSQTLKIGNFVLNNNNKPVLDTSKAYIQVAAGGNNNVNACLIEPINSASSSLGTSTNKWKSLNGINPGALSLPSISSTGANAWIALDTTDWVKSPATSTAQKYTPPADGWLNVRVDNATMLGLALTDGGNYMHQMVRSETPNGLALLMPVFKNTEVAIMVSGNENLSYNRTTFYPCKGNV